MKGQLRPASVVGSGAKRILLVFLALLLCLIALFPRHAQSLLQAVGQPVAQAMAVPIEALAAFDRGIRNLWNRYLALQGVYDQNLELKREIEQLQAQASQLREKALVGERLAAILDFQSSTPFDTVAARVIGWNASNWYRAVLLDKGKQDGVLTDMGVITPAGVVGRVVKTAPSTSIVLLLNDPNGAITALVQRTRDEGIIQGVAQGSVRMKYIPPFAPVQVEDLVVTSGLMKNFPRGLLIGRVSRILTEEVDLFQSVEIQPAVDFSKLEEVLVVTSLQSSSGLTPDSSDGVSASIP